MGSLSSSATNRPRRTLQSRRLADQSWARHRKLVARACSMPVGPGGARGACAWWWPCPSARHIGNHALMRSDRQAAGLPNTSHRQETLSWQSLADSGRPTRQAALPLLCELMHSFADASALIPARGGNADSMRFRCKFPPSSPSRPKASHRPFSARGARIRLTWQQRRRQGERREQGSARIGRANNKGRVSSNGRANMIEPLR